jgi:hypothetical protein
MAIHVHADGVKRCLWTAVTNGPTVHPPGDTYGGPWWNGSDRENGRTRRNCPSATLSTTFLTWTDLGANQGLRGERPATYGLSHGTASSVVTLSLWLQLFSYWSKRLLIRASSCVGLQSRMQKSPSRRRTIFRLLLLYTSLRWLSYFVYYHALLWRHGVVTTCCLYGKLTTDVNGLGFRLKCCHIMEGRSNS